MDRVQEVLCNFLKKHPSSDVVEVTVDTSVGSGGDLVPYLNLWAFQLQGGQNLDAALQQADDEEAMDFLYDVLDQRGSFSLEHEIGRLYPHWPEQIHEGDRALRRELRTVLETFPAGMAPHTHVFFHHVDGFPLWDLREPEME